MKHLRSRTSGAGWLALAITLVAIGCDGTGNGEARTTGTEVATTTVPPTSPPTTPTSIVATDPAVTTTSAPVETVPAPTSVPSTAPRPPVTYETETDLERADQSVFDYDAEPDVEYEVIDTRKYRGIEMQRIKFESPVGGIAYGYLAEPVGEPVPGVGVLRAHGVPVDGTDEFIPMAMLACAGVISIVVDAPYARPGANRMGDPLWFTPQDRDEQIQLIIDMRRALDLLADRGVERFGLGGISYGGAIAGLLLGVEPRIETAVLILGNGGIVERFVDEEGEPVWPLSDLSDEEIVEWRDAMSPVEPIRFVGDTEASVLFMNGVRDPLIPPAEAERYHAAGPPDSEVFWMDIDHDIPFDDMKNIHNRWFADHLGIDADRLDTCTDDLFPNGWDDL